MIDLLTRFLGTASTTVTDPKNSTASYRLPNNLMYI